MKKLGISESPETGNGEIVIYQPDEVMKLEVRVDGDTVWLTQAQMSDLFDRDRTVITKHIRNIFSEMELDEKSNVHFLHFANSDKPVKLFSLDVIISVGYRVKSIQGTRFRQWANKILKEYLYRGYCLNSRLTAIEHRLDDHEKKIDFFVRTSLPPIEGIFYNGQIFDAYVFVSDLIKSARKSIILIDNYIDESVLLMLSKRSEGVSAEIRTGRMSESLQLDIRKHNNQYEPIRLLQTLDIHDRFLIIDTDIYHIGASLKDLGKILFAFSKMSIDLDRLRHPCFNNILILNTLEILRSVFLPTLASVISHSTSSYATHEHPRSTTRETEKKGYSPFIDHLSYTWTIKLITNHAIQTICLDCVYRSGKHKENEIISAATQTKQPFYLYHEVALTFDFHQICMTAV